MKNPGSLNLYGYCEGNPVMSSDPTGHRVYDDNGKAKGASTIKTGVAVCELNVYEKPNNSSRESGHYVSKGDKVTILDTSGEFAYVSYPVRGGSREGWVHKKYLKQGGKASSNITYGVFAGGSLYVLSRTLNNTIRDHLKESDFKGTEAALKGEKIVWYDTNNEIQHLPEMNNSLNSLNNVIQGLDKLIANESAPKSVKLEAKKFLDIAQNYKSRITSLYDKYDYPYAGKPSDIERVGNTEITPEGEEGLKGGGGEPIRFLDR